MNPALHRFKPFRMLLLSLPLLGMLAACGGGSGSTTAAETTTATTATAPDPVTMSITMTGDQQVPAVTTAATGSGSFTLDRSTGALSGSVTLDGITATAVHIHDGEAGSNGGVIVNLSETASNTWSVPANTVLTAAQIASFGNGALHLNAHTAANPAGEIRGQLHRKVRVATLNGGHEVPSTASAAAGAGFLSVDPVTRAASGSITLSGMTATMAHVHQGAFGQNGGVLINLAQSAADSNTWTVPANTTLSASQYLDFLNNNLYFNVHSAAFPAGEIRGQIDDDAHHH